MKLFNDILRILGMWFLTWALVATLMVCILGVVGCASARPKAESWDQENLKRNDHGCPTAIFIAPGGVLTQC